MRIWSVLRRLSLREVLQLTSVMLQNPLCIIPTLKATKQTLNICNTIYENTHHKHGKANAFRHALWNVLICQKTVYFTKNDEKSIIWAQKVTDLHEKLAPNESLEEAMDLHNNKIGRSCFITLKSSSEEEIITFLKKTTQNAKEITEIKDILDHQNNLVYLSEE